MENQIKQLEARIQELEHQTHALMTIYNFCIAALAKEDAAEMNEALDIFFEDMPVQPSTRFLSYALAHLKVRLKARAEWTVPVEVEHDA